LGKGENGVSVGEIYRVSQEPTNESGIEVSLEVKSYESETFRSKTANLVEWFPTGSRIIFKYKGGFHTNEIIYTPQDVKHVEVLGDFTFNRYDTDTCSSRNYSYVNTYSVRMGGVVYNYTSNVQKRRNFSKYVIVDVPIGKLSIPISREGIENTPLNDKVFQEIETHLDTIYERERSNITVPKMGSLVSGKESLSKQFEGDWFNHDFRSSFPMTSHHYYKFAKKKNIDDAGYNEISDTNGKYLVYILPNIKSLTNWHKRLIQSLSKIQGTDYKGYIYTTKKDHDELMSKLDNTIDISDLIFVDVKTLKLPKLEKGLDKDSVSYLCWDLYGTKSYYTAEELDEFVTKRYFKV
jgi:hypothetical protein